MVLTTFPCCFLGLLESKNKTKQDNDYKIILQVLTYYTHIKNYFHYSFLHITLIPCLLSRENSNMYSWKIYVPKEWHSPQFPKFKCGAASKEISQCPILAAWDQNDRRLEPKPETIQTRIALKSEKKQLVPTAELPEGKYYSLPEKNLHILHALGMARTHARFDSVFGARRLYQIGRDHLMRLRFAATNTEPFIIQRVLLKCSHHRLRTGAIRAKEMKNICWK